MCVGPGSGQGQLPRMMYRLRDFRKGSCRAVPANHYVSVHKAALKGLEHAGRPGAILGALIHLICQRLDTVGDLQQGALMRGPL